MKKTILLSVVSSAILLAGGDIAPIQYEYMDETQFEYLEVKLPASEIIVDEPSLVVSAPKVSTHEVDKTIKKLPVPAMNTYCQSNDCDKFSGNIGAFGQSDDFWGTKDMLEKDGSALTIAAQLRAKQEFGLGFYGSGEMTGTISNSNVASNRAVLADGTWSNSGSASITQAVIGYDGDRFSAIIGRFNMENNPLVFSEKWNIVENTVQGASARVKLNKTDLTATYIRNNNNFGNLSKFARTNGDNGVYTLAVSDKTFNGLNMNAAYLFEKEDSTMKDKIHRVFTNASYLSSSKIKTTLQAGATFGDVADETYVAGLGIEKQTGPFNLLAAFSYVNDGTHAVKNRIGTRTPLLTQMLVNEEFIDSDSKTIKIAGSAVLNDIDFGIAYGRTINNGNENRNYQEIDMHVAKTFADIDLIGTLAYGDLYNENKDQKVLRVIAKYDF